MPEPQAHREGDDEWLFLRFYDFEPGGLINFNVVTLKRTGSGPWTQTVNSTRLLPLRQADLISAFEQAGFTAITCYGGMDGAPFDPDKSGNLIITAVKP